MSEPSPNSGLYLKSPVNALSSSLDLSPNAQCDLKNTELGVVMAVARAATGAKVG